MPIRPGVHLEQTPTMSPFKLPPEPCPLAPAPPLLFHPQQMSSLPGLWSLNAGSSNPAHSSYPVFVPQAQGPVRYSSSWPHIPHHHLSS